MWRSISVRHSRHTYATHKKANSTVARRAAALIAEKLKHTEGAFTEVARKIAASSQYIHAGKYSVKWKERRLISEWATYSKDAVLSNTDFNVRYKYLSTIFTISWKVMFSSIQRILVHDNSNNEDLHKLPSTNSCVSIALNYCR